MRPDRIDPVGRRQCGPVKGRKVIYRQYDSFHVEESFFFSQESVIPSA
jgi:hypothetical protein